jgi:uncharacterized protein YdiU (UPF0061 family)
VLVEKDLSIVAIVGENMKESTGISGKLFNILGKNNFGERAGTLYSDATKKVEENKDLYKAQIEELQKSLEDGDEELLNDLMDWMRRVQPDFTNTFRGLVEPHLHTDLIFKSNEFTSWKSRWLKRISSVDNYENILEDYNPSVIPRNHLVEEALLEASESNDLSSFNDLLDKIQNPFKSYNSMKFQTPPVSESGYKTFCGT